MKSFKIESSAITHIGAVREHNEDNYYINGKYRQDSNLGTEGYSDNKARDAYLYAVCDGMGGESFGELASLIAVSVLTKFQNADIRKSMSDYIRVTNRLICDEIKKYKGRSGGTTLALLSIQGNKAVTCNLGDSRVYFCRNEDLYLLSEDHVETIDNKNKLTQYLGIFHEKKVIRPYISKDLKIKKNDVFLLCSDGLTDVVNVDDIADILSMENESTSNMVRLLANASQNNSGKDNVTIIVIKII
ncbi:MAG: serine/threonine-protein phosphatase [Oscillospiraceae bacterium]|nr:serine/threonine-protein phosphatase [Oscillospiraceae bacterium]